MTGMRVKSGLLLLLVVTMIVATATPTRSAAPTAALPSHSFSRRTDYFVKHGAKKRLVNKLRHHSALQDLLSDEDHVTDEDFEKSFTGNRHDVIRNEVNTGMIVEEDEFVVAPYMEEEEIVHPLLLAESMLPPPPPQYLQQLKLETSDTVPFFALPSAGKSIHPTGETFLPYAPSFSERIFPDFPQGKSFNHPPRPPLLPPHLSRGRSLGPPRRRGAPGLPPLGPPTPAPNNPPPIYRHHTEIKQLEGGKSLQMKAPNHYFDDRIKEKSKERYAPKYPRYNPLGKVRLSLGRRGRGKTSRSSKKKKKSSRRKSSSKNSYRTYSSGRGGSRRSTHPLLDTLSRPHQHRSSQRGRGYAPCHGKKSKSCHHGSENHGARKSFRTYSRESRPFRDNTLKKHHIVTVLPFVPVIPHHRGPPHPGGLLPYGDFHHSSDGSLGRSKSLYHGPPGPERNTVVVHTRHVYKGLQRPAVHVHERVNFLERHTPYLKEHYGYASHTFDPLPAFPDFRLAEGMPLHHGFK